MVLHYMQLRLLRPPVATVTAPCSPACARGCRDAVGNWKLVGYGVGTLHILLRLFIYWNVKFASSVQFQRVGRHEDATDVLVLPTEFSGLPEIVSLLHRTLVSTRSSWSSFLRPSSTMMRPMHPIMSIWAPCGVADGLRARAGH